MWNIEDFIFADSKSHITYKSMKVAVLEKPNIPCDMILSASMFMKMKYTIDCSSLKHILAIEADRAVYGVDHYDKKETIYIFAKD